MILLDTDVLSAVMRAFPDEKVTNWLDLQLDDSIWIASITVMEILFGLRILPAGRRRQELTQAFKVLLEEKIRGRIAPFDTTAAEHAGELMALRKVTGKPVDYRDTMIAGIALATRATVATRNTSHFSELSVALVNPWTL